MQEFAALVMMAQILVTPGSLCELDRLEECTTTNRLVASKGFLSALREFVGENRSDWLYPGETEFEQVLTALGGPSDPPLYLTEEIRRFSGCRFHSCLEKALVFIGNSGEILAAGIMHFNCSGSCDDEYTMTLYLREFHPLIIKNTIEWSLKKIHETRSKSKFFEYMAIGKIEIRYK